VVAGAAASAAEYRCSYCRCLTGSASARTLSGSGDVRFHDLRHAYATRLLERGVHPKVVSQALGHSSISITMDTDSHVMPSMSQLAADAIAVVLGE